MANENRISGLLYTKVDGTQLDVMGDWTYRINPRKREAEVGSDKIHGYKELPQAVFIEGEARDASDLDLLKLQSVSNSTIQLELANGKTVVLRNAWYAADGDVGTESANIQMRFEGLSGEEV